MVNSFALIKSLPALGACVLAYTFPTIPDDLTTPYQQRLAVTGPKSAKPCIFLDVKKCHAN
jgi:acid phosphatase